MNKKIIRNVLIYLILIVTVTVQQVCAVSQSGGIAGQMMLWGVNARAIGMGRMYLSIADDASTCYWNPANMNLVDRKSISSMYSSLLGLSQYTYFGFVYPTIGTESWGGAFIQLSSGEFDKRDSNGSPLGSFEVAHRALLLAYSRQLTDSLSFGTSFTSLSNTVDSIGDSAILCDIATYYRLQNIRMSGAVKNIISYSLGSLSKDNYPLIIKLGMSVYTLDDSLLIGIDMNRIENSSAIEWAIGGEYKLLERFFLRAGFNSGDLYGGIGVGYSDVKVDLALHMSEVANSYFFSINYAFGDSRIVERENVISANISKMESKIADAKYHEAGVAGDYILSLDAGNNAVRNKVRRLKKVTDIVDINAKSQEYSSDKVRELITYAVKEYLVEDETKAVNKLQYVLFLQPEHNSIAKDLLAYLLNTTDENKLAGSDIVGEKMKESLVNFYGSKYDEVIKNCDEVIQLDQNNIDAYLRKGSAYFMILQEEKAIESWQKVLEINPNMKEEIEKIIQNLKKTRATLSSDDDSGNDNNQETDNSETTIKGISIGTFKDERSAEKRVRELEKNNIPVEISKNNGMYRVYVNGKGKTFEELKSIFEELVNRNYKAYWMK
ncbi:MAG: hypothetical protein A2X42_10665 [Candidatus Margulisbacteria bacterium GWF2_38_17]|nr:MAG: hypothetical protein A2X42_10665 [Candidatus Margulisbacteria bacterium GWF2_38_17]